MVLIFVFWNISFRVCNDDCVIPRFGKNVFINFYSVFLKLIILLILKKTFVHLQWLSNHTFSFRASNTDFIMPGFYEQFIFKCFYSVVEENIILLILKTNFYILVIKTEFLKHTLLDFTFLQPLTVSSPHLSRQIFLSSSTLQ